MLDRVTGMQVFARVAALGSLSAAARALNMSQTMATKHITAMETRLGTKLLHRSTRRMSLTEPGKNYLDAVERILNDLDDAESQAASDATEVRGTLRLNAPVSFGIRELAPLIPELIRRHPELTIDLGLNDRQVDLVEEGWDLAIRIGTLKDATTIARRLATCKMIVCASPAYLKTYGKPRTIADLKNHNCLGYTLSRNVGANKWSFDANGKTEVAISGNLQANNGDALVVAAVAGHGIVYQPTFLVAQEIQAGRLVSLKLDHVVIELTGIFAIYPSARRPPAKVRATIDFLAAQYANVPPWDRRAKSI
ncbi:MAG: LysR family transcriptional regulator [Hyphomicrobiaceae bacterium]